MLKSDALLNVPVRHILEASPIFDDFSSHSLISPPYIFRVSIALRLLPRRGGIGLDFELRVSPFEDSDEPRVVGFGLMLLWMTVGWVQSQADRYGY